MLVRSIILRGLAATLVLSGPLLGYAAGARPASGGARSHHVYRLDYVVTVTEPGKAPLVSTQTMNVEENGSGDLRAGANIPLVAAPGSPGFSSPRQDVGLSLHTQVTRAGDDLVLHHSTEISAPADADGAMGGGRAIRKIVANGDAVASMGTPTTVSSVEEQVTHARYTVSVTATRLR
jgi:hypothetical protein